MTNDQKVSDPRGRRHSRGYLPHIEAPGLTQFVTFRLADSLPKTTLQTLRFKLETRQINEIEYHWAVDKALDLGEGPTYLQNANIARLVAESLKRFDNHRYTLHSWVIMPNHVHLLLSSLGNHELGEIVHSIKSYTALMANRTLGKTGRFWSTDYFDRFIRDYVHFSKTKKCIEENPVKARLCKSPAEWPWGNLGYK